MGSSRTWFRLPFVYRNRAERRASPALSAVHWEGSTPRQASVANISSSGAYLRTTENWKPGEILSLTLQRAGELEHSPQRRVTVQAKSVRRDRNGTAVAFLLPRGADVRLWQSAIKAEVRQDEPEDVVREFRLAAAIAFIHRVAPGAAEAAKVLCREGLSNFRLESAIEIALHAEELLSLEGNGASLHASPTVVVRALDDGSWAETEWIQHYWGGIVATSCVPGKPDTSCLKFVKLLSQLTTIQARIFAGSCAQASKIVGPGGIVFARPLTCPAEDIVQIADTHDRVHVERDIQQLAELGLIEKSVKWKVLSQMEEADITPTPQALELYARCHGHRGEIADFYDELPCSASLTAVN